MSHFYAHLQWRMCPAGACNAVWLLQVCRDMLHLQLETLYNALVFNKFLAYAFSRCAKHLPLFPIDDMFCRRERLTLLCKNQYPV